MSYTRLSTNFQPKIDNYSRRQFFCGSDATLAGCKSLSIRAFAASSMEVLPLMTHAITTEEGKYFTIDKLRGRPVLINFWATWCAPCIAELPALQTAAEQLQVYGIEVLLISVDRGGAKKALPVLQKNGVTKPRFGFDQKARLSREMEVAGLPTSFLLSADQRRCLVYVGPREWDKDQMLKEIRQFAEGNNASKNDPTGY